MQLYLVQLTLFFLFTQVTAMSCPVCLDLFRYPVTLSCGHSLCKPCALQGDQGGGGINVLCPLCRTNTHFESENEIQINKTLQTAVDVMKGTAVPRVPCMRCEQVEATVDCSECNVKLCSSCSDLVHVGRLKAHRLCYDASAVQCPTKPPFCSEMGHGNYRTDLYCTDCNILMCVVCSQVSPTHRGHHVIPLSQAADVEKVKLKQTLESALQFRKELKQVSAAVDKAIVESERSSEEEILVFTRTIDTMIRHLEKRRDALVAEARDIQVEESIRLRKIKEQVVSLASKLNDSVSFSQRALSIDSSVDILRGRVEMEKQLGNHDPIVLPQLRIPQFSIPHYQILISGIDACSVDCAGSAPDVEAAPSAVLEASSIFKRKGFKFSKSTYNDIQIFNKGLSAMSSNKTWETVMCDTVLMHGVQYFEVKIDRYDATNGHNVIVGIVFDGGFELCEVIGEDENSVGFNTGRGTKVVNGNFFQSYSDSCSQGDVIGVKLDYQSGTVEFFRNAISMGVAFTGLSKPCYAAVSMINRQQVSLMFPMRIPI